MGRPWSSTAPRATLALLAVLVVAASAQLLRVDVDRATPEAEARAVRAPPPERSPPVASHRSAAGEPDRPGGAGADECVLRVRDERELSPLAGVRASLVALEFDPADGSAFMGPLQALGVSDAEGAVAVSRGVLGARHAGTAFVMLRREGYVPRLVPVAALGKGVVVVLQPCSWVSLTSSPGPDPPAGYRRVALRPSRAGAAWAAGGAVLLSHADTGYLMAECVERGSVVPHAAVFGLVPGVSYELDVSARVGRSLVRGSATVCPPAPVALRLEAVPTHVVRLVPPRDTGRAFAACAERGSVPVEIHGGTLALIDLDRLGEHAWTFHASGADWSLEQPLHLDLTGGHAAWCGRESTARTVDAAGHVLALDLPRGLSRDDVVLCAPVGENGEWRVLDAARSAGSDVHVTRRPDGFHVRGLSNAPVRLFALSQEGSCAVPFTLRDPTGRTAIVIEPGRRCSLADERLRALARRFGHDARFAVEQEVAWPDGYALWVSVASPTLERGEMRVPWTLRVHEGRRYRLQVRAPNGAIEHALLEPDDFRDA